MRIAEGVRSEWLGCCKRFLRAELNISLDGSKPLAKIARIVADRLTQSIAADLKGVREARANG
jgi:hypothetical protein